MAKYKVMIGFETKKGASVNALYGMPLTIAMYDTKERAFEKGKQLIQRAVRKGVLDLKTYEGRFIDYDRIEGFAITKGVITKRGYEYRVIDAYHKNDFVV